MPLYQCLSGRLGGLYKFQSCNLNIAEGHYMEDSHHGLCITLFKGFPCFFIITIEAA